MKAWFAWLGVALVGSLVLAGCGSNNSSTVTIAITPTSATVLLGTSLQFIPSVTGSSNAVTWSVNGAVNGNATFGTISSTGLYTAPTTPIPASRVAVPIVLTIANASIPNSGLTGSVIELQSGFNFANFTPGNTITIAGNSQAGWDGSFIIQAASLLANGNVGVQIATPAGPPANGVGGTATAVPNITITAQVSSTNAVASATITLDSGVRVAINQPTCTIGTTETFTFTATVSGTSTNTVTWSRTGVGTIDKNSGLYLAPATAGTATITATSTKDPTETASATVTVAAVVAPGLSTVSPPTGALGATSMNVYLSGSNFICTTRVFVNGTPLSTGVFSLSSSALLVVLPDAILSTQPASGATSVTLTFTAASEKGAPNSCSPSTACQLTLSAVRPAIVASKPDSVTASTTPLITLDGGYFGTKNGNAVVSLLFNGSPVTPFNFLSDRELQFSAPSTATPGLYPITVVNSVSCPTGLSGCLSGSPVGAVATANLAVQPTAAPAQITSPGVGVIAVGANPTAVAINTATGVAVVTNQGSHDITVLNLGTLASPSLSISTQSLCTGTIGSLSGSCTVTTGPTSVAVDNLRNLALVANSTNQTLAVVNLSVPSVTALFTFPSADSSGTPFSLTPQAVAINPVSGRALVAFTASAVGGNGSNAGAILDMNQVQNASGSITLPAAGASPILINVVNLNNGANPHIAVSPKLNWAIATPGGAGSLSIVDLGRQTVNSTGAAGQAITNIACSSGVATVTANGTVGLFAGQPVLITGTTPANNGIFQVASVSSSSFTYPQSCSSVPTLPATANYALPVASLATTIHVGGVSINDETQKALLADPNGNVPAFVFNILDQTSALVNGVPQFHNVATAMNPLTNIGVIVNTNTNQGFVIDPTVPTVVNTFTGLNSPVDVAIDPAANTALVVNQGANSVSLFSLSPTPALRSTQIIQSSFKSAATGQISSRVTISSGLGTAATAANQTVTLIGNFTSGSVPRLDGDSSTPSVFTGVPTITNGGRVMTATIPGSFFTSSGHGPRIYALDVLDTSSQPSNAASLQAVQAVSLATGSCTNPAPQGVAIDATHNVAFVTEPGCNKVSLVNLATGTGFGAKPELDVGTSPQGVAVYPQASLAVTANAGDNTASIVNIVSDAVTPVATDPVPSGVAIDLGTGNALVTANGASVVDVFPVSTSTTAPTPTTIGVQSGPTGVAIDQKNHVAVVANSSSNTASVLDLPANTATLTSNPIAFPQGVAFDPISGEFLLTSGANNAVLALNPNTVSTLAIRVGIDPSSIAYNFETGTLITANSLSGTMSVVDFIDQTVRDVFSLQSSTQFAVDIHPQTNLAVVADTVDNQLLLVPLPH